MIIKGDVNGDGKITAEDFILAQLHAKGTIVLEGDSFTAADIDGNGSIGNADYSKILDHINGISMLTEVIY